MKALTDKHPTAEDLIPSAQRTVEAARQFLRVFRDDRPALANLAEAAASDRDEIRALALRGLVTLGRLSPVVSALAAEKQPEARRGAIAALRALPIDSQL